MAKQKFDHGSQHTCRPAERCLPPKAARAQEERTLVRFAEEAPLLVGRSLVRKHRLESRQREAVAYALSLALKAANFAYTDADGEDVERRLELGPVEDRHALVRRARRALLSRPGV